MNAHLIGEALSGVSRLLTNMYILLFGSISTSLRPNTWLKEQSSTEARLHTTDIIVLKSAPAALTHLVERPRRPLDDLGVDVSVVLHDVLHQL